MTTPFNPVRAQADIVAGWREDLAAVKLQARDAEMRHAEAERQANLCRRQIASIERILAVEAAELIRLQELERNGT